MRLAVLLLCVLCSPVVFAEASTCYGTPNDGRLKNGVRLPDKGNNFMAYSKFGRVLGRTYVHSELRDIVVDSFKALETEQPDKLYKYAEAGGKEGGLFKPHKRHQNGTSLDFTTPVVNEEGESAHLPTGLLTKFGYEIEFDENDHYKGFTIDYVAMAAHLVELHKAATAKGYDMERVMFDEELRTKLMMTKYADYLEEHIPFDNSMAWVRQDDHYHIDFSIPCLDLKLYQD